jgi:hypothetical protein
MAVRTPGWRRLSGEALNAELERLDAIETDGDERAEGEVSAYAEAIETELAQRRDEAPPAPDSPALDPAGPWGRP